MSYGPKQVYNVGIASGASTSSSLDLGLNGPVALSFNAVTMSTGAEVQVWGSTDSSTYYKVFERVNTAPVQYQALTVATNTSGTWATLPLLPFRYLQFTTSAVVSGGVSITVVAQG